MPWIVNEAAAHRPLSAVPGARCLSDRFDTEQTLREFRGRSFVDRSFVDGLGWHFGRPENKNARSVHETPRLEGVKKSLRSPEGSLGELSSAPARAQAGLRAWPSGWAGLGGWDADHACPIGSN